MWIWVGLTQIILNDYTYIYYITIDTKYYKIQILYSENRFKS